MASCQFFLIRTQSETCWPSPYHWHSLQLCIVPWNTTWDTSIVSVQWWPKVCIGSKRPVIQYSQQLIRIILIQYWRNDHVWEHSAYLAPLISGTTIISSWLSWKQITSNKDSEEPWQVSASIDHKWTLYDFILSLREIQQNNIDSCEMYC